MGCLYSSATEAVRQLHPLWHWSSLHRCCREALHRCTLWHRTSGRSDWAALQG